MLFETCVDYLDLMIDSMIQAGHIPDDGSIPVALVALDCADDAPGSNGLLSDEQVHASAKEFATGIDAQYGGEPVLSGRRSIFVPCYNLASIFCLASHDVRSDSAGLAQARRAQRRD